MFLFENVQISFNLVDCLIDLRCPKIQHSRHREFESIHDKWNKQLYFFFFRLTFITSKFSSKLGIAVLGRANGCFMSEREA